MTSPQQQLVSALGDVLAVEQESDGALTLRHDGTLASLRVVTIAEGLDLVALTQILAWDLPLTKKLRDQVSEHAHNTLLGTVTLVEKAGKATAKRSPAKTADVMLRYNFPGAGLTDDALRTLVVLVLENGAEIHRALTS
jgi:hypothetical protein